MALFRVSNKRAQFDAAGNEATDQYGAGIRFTQGGNARVTTGSATNYNQGIPMSATGQVAIVDATAGLPAGTIFHNGLPISGDKVCVSRNATAVVSNGLPHDSAGAVAGDINFDLNFIATNTLNSSVTFTRTGTNATYFNSAGVLTSAGADVPRFDYNPATLAAQGLLIEEQRTNSIRNNTMQGAVAGTPGTLPTNWAGSSPIAGLTREVVGTGTQNGINYIDVRFSGTTNTTSANIIFAEPNTSVAALNGQSWAASSWIALVGGSFTNITSSNLVLRFNDVAGSLLTTSTTSFLGATATQVRYAAAGTASNASTAFVTTCITLGFNNGVAIDITLRIGLPQLEQGAFATSVIPTTTTALTRSADVASVNTLSPWFNATASTVYFEGTIASINDSQTPYLWSISDNTKAFGARDQIALLRGPSTARLSSNVASGGVTSASISSADTAVTANTVFKAAASYAANDVKLCVNGLTPTTTASATMPSGVNTLKLGNAGWAGTVPVTAFYIRRFTYYPRSFVGAELQAITA